MSFVASTTYTSTSAGISTLTNDLVPMAVAVNGNYIFILSKNNSAESRIIYSTNAGSTWNKTTSDVINNEITTISVSQNGYVLVCGINGVYYSNNAGNTFVSLTPPANYDRIGVISNDGSTLYVGQSGGPGGTNYNYIWRSNTNINPNSWATVFGPSVPIYNDSNNGYKGNRFFQSNCILSTSSNGSYLVGASERTPFLGVNNVFSTAAPGGAKGGWSRSAIVSNTGQYILFGNSDYTYVQSVKEGLWYSTNYGVTFTYVLSNVKIFLAELDKVTGKVIIGYSDTSTIYYSTNSGATFNSFIPTISDIRDIKYNPTDCTAYMARGKSVLTYTLPLLPPTVTINGTTVAINGTVTVKARTKTVTVEATPTDLRTVSSITGTTNLEDDLNTIAITMSNGTVYNVYVMVLRNCFKEGTKILCLINDEEKYVPVEELRKGSLVKTRLNGYVPIHSIGHSKLYNPANKLRGLNRLYKCTKENYPEVTEDLLITGCHSILVDESEITDEIREKTRELTKDNVWVTDYKCRLLTCLDERAEPYEEEGVFNIWHFALEHFDNFMNYGVYANGLLVETCDINSLHEYSGLELV
jgi:hypothetical protein